MTFPRPRRRTCPQTLPTSLPPARALGLKGAGVGGEPAPRVEGSSHPFPSGLRLWLSAGGRGGARRSPGGAGLRGLQLAFLNRPLVVFKFSQSSTLWEPYPVPRIPIPDYPERPDSGESVEETRLDCDTPDSKGWGAG